MATATTNGTHANGTSNGTAPKIILYTNHLCPWAHRAHIILSELGLDYDEVFIDLETPREPWYLKVNPRGLVPTISYNGNIIPESGIVAQFLADAHPSHLLPSSDSLEGALYRAKLNFFVDAYMSKAQPHMMAGQRAQSAEEKDKCAEAFVAAVVKEVEPCLGGAEGGPFFGGSDRLTLAEVQTGSFILRLDAFSKPQYGLLSPNLPRMLEKQAPKFKRWMDAVVKEKSVNFIWDEQKIAERTKAKLAKTVAK